MRVFLTGATGFVGSFLAESLLKKNYHVCCLVRKQSNLRWIHNLGVEYFYGSLHEPDSLKPALKDCDYVYHVAGVTKAPSEKEFMEGNYEITKNLVNACMNFELAMKRFVYVSSQAAAGPSPTLVPIDETFPENPISYYGKSKLAAEKYLNKLKNRIPITIVRPPVVYGPRDKDLYEFFRIVIKGIIPRISGGERYISIIQVRDLVRGIINSTESEKSKGETYFIANSTPCNWEELISTTLKIVGKKGIKISLPITLVKVAAIINESIAKIIKKPSPAFSRQKAIEMQQCFWTCSVDKAKKELNFKSEINLEEGVRETLEWYRENKWLHW
jgi:dihydroflavonol-4-reductase